MILKGSPEACAKATEEQRNALESLERNTKRLSRTLECISEILLSDHANWSRIFLTEWSLYELYLGRNNVYRSLNELAHFNKALKTNNYHYSVISTLSYRKRNDLLNLIV